MRVIKIEFYFIALTLFLGSNFYLNAQNNRPNIVLIMADDLGFESIAANGGTSYQTPNIDKIAFYIDNIPNNDKG